jgi:4-aminobutyrate aminotransferase/(S)-3-amino-2-methylpropionate transaminase
LSLTSKIHPYKAGFGPMVSDVVRAPFAYCYRCSGNLEYPQCGLACIETLEDRLCRYADPGAIAALIVEPVLGEGGFVVPPPEYLPKVADLCRRYGILLIADEIQTGFGRTGRMFACEHFGLQPDLLVTGKSLAGGLPLAAVVGRAELMDAPGLGSLGGTFAGNPLACAAAEAVLDIYERTDLLARAEQIGAEIASRAQRWAADLQMVGEVRRLGAMVGIELVRDRQRKKPAAQETTAIVRLAAERGVLLIGAGTFGNVVRILVPLVVSPEQLGEGLEVLHRCFEEVAATPAPAYA